MPDRLLARGPTGSTSPGGLIGWRKAELLGGLRLGEVRRSPHGVLAPASAWQGIDIPSSPALPDEPGSLPERPKANSREGPEPPPCSGASYPQPREIPTPLSTRSWAALCVAYVAEPHRSARQVEVVLE